MIQDTQEVFKKPTWFKWKRRVLLFFAHSFCMSVAISCLFPLVWMLSSSLKTQSTVFSDMSIFPKTFNYANYTAAWLKGNFGVYFFNSIAYTVIVVFGILAVTSMAAFAFSRLEFPGKNVFFIVLVATMMIPVPGAFIALYVLISKLGIYDTRLGYLLPQINGGLAMGVYLLKTFFDKLPRDLEDAAKIDGCNKFQVYLHVALPLAKPALAVLAIFNSLYVWNEYLFAVVALQTNSIMPIQRGLMMFQGEHATQYALLMAAITITVVPIIIMYLIMQKHIISGITEGAIKS